MSFIGKLKVGTEVLVSNTPKFVDKKATVMFVGKLPGGGKNQEFIGVELQTPDGTHSGQFEGKEYFKAKQNHGMFAKPKAVKLADGTPLTTLLTVTTKQATKTSTIRVPTTQTKPSSTTRTQMGGSKKQPQLKPSLVEQNKLSQQLKELQLNQQQIESLKEQNQSLKQSIQTLRQQLQQSKKKIQALQSTDIQQQILAMRQRIRQLQDQNRMLHVQEQKAKLQTSQSSQEKTRQLQQKIEFFNSQKQFHEKQKADLKKKILRLEQQLDSYEGNLQQFQKLTYKIESLQAKNVKLRQQLEQYKTESRNNQMLSKSGKDLTVSDDGKLEELEQNIKVLNETVSLMEGELEEERQRAVGLETELQALKAKSGDVGRLEKKLKSRDQQLQALKAQLQVTADAATFAQKLTLDLLRKQEELKQTTVKLSQYLNQIQCLQLQVSESKQMVDLQTIQLQTQQQQIQKHILQKQQQQLHIVELNKQISKYKSKISQLTQNNQSLLSTTSQMMSDVADEQEYNLKLSISTDNYQQRYFQTLKIVQQLSQRYFELELQSSRIKNIVGVQMLNIVQTIPEGYTQQFYPEIVKIIIDIKSVNDKLYLLFDAASTYLKTRGDVYTKDNIQKARFLVMLMQQLPLVYSQLTKIQLSLTTASSQEEITDIVSNTAIKQMLRKIDYAASQMLLKFSGDNIDPSIDLAPFIDPVETLDNICAQGRKLEYEYQTRNKLCLETMTAIQKIFAAILTLKQVSELKQSAQVDNIIEAFLKHLLQYLKECCNNPQLRIKTQTKQYLSNLQFTINILEQIQINETTNELSSLYSQIEEIKMLKETILSTHHHLKQLIDDLGEIVYPNELSKIKCNLSGKVWIQRSASINQELGRVQQLMAERQVLHSNLLEAKKKIIILEKQIKDRQATKQLHEKRIGQLLLKVEQAYTYEVENKRYKDKLRTYEDTNKLIEDELQSQVSKRKELQDEVRKLKDKVFALQTEGLQKSKEKKVSSLVSSSPSEEVTSLALFKNVLKECDFLKTVELKKKILQIKQSPLIAKLNQENQKESIQSKSINMPQNIRRKAINAMCEMKIIDPRIKDPKEKSALINSNLILKSLQMQVEKYNFAHPLNPENKQKQEVVEMKIGSFLLKNRSQNLNAKLSVGNFKIMSFQQSQHRVNK